MRSNDPKNKQARAMLEDDSDTVMQDDEESEYVAAMASESDNEEQGSSSSSVEGDENDADIIHGHEEEEEDSDYYDAYFPEDGSSAAAFGGMSSSSMQSLQGKLQVNDQSLGPSMHEGDDEGRESASQVAARRVLKRDEQQAQGQGNCDNNDDAQSRTASDAAEVEVGQSDNSSGRRRRRRSARPATTTNSRRRVKRCWLCTFANCKMAKRVSTFVATNAGVMDPAIMADQIKREVLNEYPLAKGIGRHHILCHIREHVLIPGVRLASIVRSLITLAETLRCTLQQVDEETGDMAVDIRNTELYLKVVTQITNVYKLDGTKLLFQNGVSPPLARPVAAPASAARGTGGGGSGSGSTGTTAEARPDNNL